MLPVGAVLDTVAVTGLPPAGEIEAAPPHVPPIRDQVYPVAVAPVKVAVSCTDHAVNLFVSAMEPLTAAVKVRTGLVNDPG